MPFFKKKQIRSDRIDELEAHVKNIRRIAAEDPNGVDALQSFLIEDSSWDLGAPVQEARDKTAGTPSAHRPEPPQSQMVTAADVDQPKAAPGEDEAMLQAELERYLNRMAEEATPDPNADAEYEEYQR